MKTIKMALLILFIASIVVGCGNSNDFTVEGKVNVVTSFYPLYDFAQKIGGEHVNVINLVPAGVESHDWSPKPRDMSNITKADVFIYNGAGFEGWVDDFLDSLKKDSSLLVVEAIHDVDLIEIGEDAHAEEEHAEDAHAEEEHAENAHAEEEHTEDAHADEAHADEHAGEEEHAHGDVDPHAWLSPLQAKAMAATIKEHLIEADPSHKDDYEANYSLLADRLQQLHDQFVQTVAQAPKKEIVVSHEAFGYIARDYGITQIGVMGLSPDAEPTVQRMNEITNFAKEHEIKYILFEELVSPKLAETLAKSLDIETLVLNPLEGLTEEQVTAKEDYFTIMAKNLTTIEKALQ
jgi:zinc transport system substrate-binding protein